MRSTRFETTTKTTTNRPLLTRPEAAARLAVPTGTLAAWASRGQGPPFIKLGRAVRYRPDDLDAWISSNTIAPDGDGGPRRSPAGVSG